MEWTKYQLIILYIIEFKGYNIKVDNIIKGREKGMI